MGNFLEVWRMTLEPPHCCHRQKENLCDGARKRLHELSSMVAMEEKGHAMNWIDPLSLPSIEGAVDRFLFNADGDADGFLFANGQQVHFPPQLSQALLKRVKIGDHVRARGLKPRGADVLVALSLTTRSGHTIEDPGPTATGLAALHKSKHKSKPVQLVGVVKRCLYAPRGEICGALLEDGCILRMHPKGNEELLHFLKSGSEVTVWGDRIRVKGQYVVDIAYLASA
jgi:hypothetical protein